MHTDADIRIDHFHVAGLMVKALEQVRRAEHSKLARQGDDRLKGTRFDWLMTPQRMSPQRRRRLDEMLKQDLRVCEAWRLKEWVAEIWFQVGRGGNGQIIQPRRNLGTDQFITGPVRLVNPSALTGPAPATA